ncbi:MAG: DUF3383 family protein [Chitinophagaceae bacterium]|nr:MAG: DUF3383 family protein [Chitinophagaceae bacterium]
MSELSQIVQINISRASTAIATASFQIPMILATHTVFADRARTYTDIDAVADDFDSTDNVYIIASKLFGQSTVGAVPPSIIVGRRQVDSVTFTPTVANNTVYTVTINGVAYSITSSGSATATNIVSALTAAIGTVTGITISGTTSLTVAPSVVGSPWSVSATDNLVGVQAVPTETWVDALDAVTDANDTWYALVAETHLPADQLALATAIQARRKIYGTSTADATVPTSATTDIASQLSAADYSRTFIVYQPQADTMFPEAVWIGAQLAYTPGSNDWDLKQGVGVTTSTTSLGLSDTVRSYLRTKNANMYSTIAGVNVFQDGNMSDGSPIDEIVLIDWLYARLQEGIFSRLINSLKVPMTNPGLTIIENEIRTVLSQAEGNGGIDRNWKVTTPDVLDIPETMRAQRTAGTFVFRARLAGSIRKVIIQGYLSV